jgi:uncharacterized protein YjbI with pentapeptide repeats
MNPGRGSRLPYQESCELLQRLEYCGAGAAPPIPDRRPQFDDKEPLGLTFFRTLLAEGKLENLTLPRTYFGRSEVRQISFKNTDLSESTLCWNNFTEIDFTDGDLSGCDLRASIFIGAVFVRANLLDADLRRSTFRECDFTDANLRGAKLTRKQGEQIHLSDSQRESVDWQEVDGDAPPGG